MKSRSLAVLAIFAFVMGALVPPVYATTVTSSYTMVAGGSASCTMVRASTNNSTERGGGQTTNFKGCSSSNPQVDMPAGYLAVTPEVWTSGGSNCGTVSSAILSDHVSSSVSGSSATNSLCDIPGNYHGEAIGYRKTASGSFVSARQAAGNLYFAR